MNPDKKIRCDAKLKSLPWEVQLEMFELCNKPDTKQVDVLAWLEGEHQIRSSKASLSEWLPWFIARKRSKDREQKVDAELEELAREHPELTPQQLFEIGQRKFSLYAIADGDPDAWVNVQLAGVAREDLERKKAGDKGRAEFKREELNIALRKLALLERKQAEAVKVTEDKTLSPEEYKRRMREIFKR